MSGAIVKWLEWLGYGAESRHKVVNARLGFTMGRLDSSLCQPGSKWVPFFNQGRVRQAVPKIQRGTLTPTAPTAIRLCKSPLNVTPHQDRLGKTVLIRGHTICFFFYFWGGGGE